MDFPQAFIASTQKTLPKKEAGWSGFGLEWFLSRYSKRGQKWIKTTFYPWNGAFVEILPHKASCVYKSPFSLGIFEV